MLCKRLRILFIFLLLLTLSSTTHNHRAFAATALTYEGKVFSVTQKSIDFIEFYVDGVLKKTVLLNTLDEVQQYDAYIESIDNLTLSFTNNQYSIPVPQLELTWTQSRRTGSIQKITVQPISELIAGTVAKPTILQSGTTTTIEYPSEAFYKKYRLNSGTWNNYISPVTSGLVEAISGDKFGHISSIAYQETTPPSISLSASPLTISRYVTISTNITDTSGIAEQKYAYGSHNIDYMAVVGHGETIPYTNSFQVYENGTYTIYAKDNAGNKAIKTITISNIDRIPPITPTLTVNTTAPAYEVTVTINYPSDAYRKQYRIGTGYWMDYTVPIKITANGTVYARALDQVGNISQESSVVVQNIDNKIEYKYDQNGRLTEFHSLRGSYRFEYDNNGNLMKRIKIN